MILLQRDPPTEPGILSDLTGDFPDTPGDQVSGRRGLGSRGGALQAFTAEQIVRAGPGPLRERLCQVLTDLCWAELEARR